MRYLFLGAALLSGCGDRWECYDVYARGVTNGASVEYRRRGFATAQEARAYLAGLPDALDAVTLTGPTLCPGERK